MRMFNNVATEFFVVSCLWSTQHSQGSEVLNTSLTEALTTSLTEDLTEVTNTSLTTPATHLYAGSNTILTLVLVLLGSLTLTGLALVCALQESIRRCCKRRGGNNKTEEQDNEMGDVEAPASPVFSVTTAFSGVERSTAENLLASLPGDVNVGVLNIPSASSSISKTSMGSRASLGSRSRRRMGIDFLSDLINTTDDNSPLPSPAPTQKQKITNKKKKKKDKKAKDKNIKEPESPVKPFGFGNTAQSLSRMRKMRPGLGPFSMDAETGVTSDSVESLITCSSASQTVASIGTPSEDLDPLDDLKGIENELFFFCDDMVNFSRPPGANPTGSFEDLERQVPSLSAQDVSGLQSHVVSDVTPSPRRLSMTLQTSVIARMLLKKPTTPKTRLYKKNPSATVSASNHKAAQRWTALQRAYEDLFKEDMSSLKMT